MNKYLSSSVDPSKLSLTVKGILVGIVPVAILLAKFKGVELAEGDLQPFIDSVGNVILMTGAALSAVWTIYGAARKLWVRFGK